LADPRVTLGPQDEILAKSEAGDLVLADGSPFLAFVTKNGQPVRSPVPYAESLREIPRDAAAGSFFVVGTELVQVQRTAPQVVVTPAGDGRPAPFAECSVDVEVADAASVSLFRRAGGRTYKVRGFVKKPTTKVLTARDFEAPLGRPFAYYAEVYSRTGALLHRTEDVPAELPSTLRRSAVIHNVLDPAGAVTVTLAESAIASLARSAALTMLGTSGRSAPAVIGGVRGALAGLALDCYTDTAEAADKLWRALGAYDAPSSSVLCVRLSPDAPLPGTLYVAVPSPEARPIGAAQGDAHVAWKLTADEVTPPAPALATPVFTYAHLSSALGAYRESYSDFASAYSRYRDATLDVKVGPWQ
jgi:hypothetical protein